MSFWEVVKEVSARPVRREADRQFVLALAGEPGAVAVARAAALGAFPAPEEAAGAAPYLLCLSPPYTAADETRLRHADVLVSLPGGPGVTEFRPAPTLQLERPEAVAAAVVAEYPALLVALGRRLPGFRAAAADYLIRQVSMVNAEFAVVSGVSQSIPVLAPLFPAVMGTDIVLLTKNQVLMVFRLAAIYGEALDLASRAREVLPVIGGAFGWRTLSRQLLGFLPGGLGLPVRAGVAYSGTYAVGRAAQMAFDEGRRPTRREMLRIYEEAGHLARGVVGSLASRFPSGRAASPQLPDGKESLVRPVAGGAEEKDGR